MPPPSRGLGSDALPPRRWFRGATAAAYVLYILVVTSVVPWRSQAIFSGGFDIVVLAKAIIACAALGGALVLAARTRRRVPVGLGPAFIVLLTLLITTLGAFLAGNFGPTAVLSIRVILVAATIFVILTAVTATRAIACLLAAMGTIAVVAAVTGAPELLTEGRIGGGVPDIHPNELGALAGTPLVGLITIMLRSGIRAGPALGASILAAILVGTGSRTALLAVAVATLVSLAANGIRSRDVTYALLGSLPVVYAIVFFTSTVETLATRTGTTTTTSALESRFDAWEVVLAWGWDVWQKWVGLGLSVKEIPVDIKWRDVQVLDSSWVSLLAQAGVIGTLLIVGLVIWCLIVSFTASSRRWYTLPLLTLIVFRSVTESGLVDSASPFVLFITLAFALTARSRRHGGTPSPPEAESYSEAIPSMPPTTVG